MKKKHRPYVKLKRLFLSRGITYIYDEDGDVVDEETLAGFLEGDGKGDDEDE